MHVPSAISRLNLRREAASLRGVRAGYEKIVAEDDAFARTPDTITLESPAFGDGGDIPDRFTAELG